MTPRDISLQLGAEMGLENMRGSEDQLWAAAGLFTVELCKRLRNAGYDFVLIKKPGGRNCGGLDCDKVVDRKNRKMYDVIGGAGAAGMRAVWNEESHLANDTSRDYIPEGAPQNGPGPEPGPQEGCKYVRPADYGPALVELATAVNRAVAMIQNLEHRQNVLEENINHEVINTRDELKREIAKANSLAERLASGTEIPVELSARWVGTLRGKVTIP